MRSEISVNFSSKLYSSTSITILFCIFENLKTNEDGGAIQLINNDLYFLSKSSFFYKCQSFLSMGGSIYCSINESYIISTCIFESNTVNYGSGVYIVTNNNENNFINLTNFISCGKISCQIGSWILGGGKCLVSNLNNSLCHSTDRESVGHFTSGPPISNVKYSLFLENSGPYIIGPYNEYDLSSNHDYCIFIKNFPNIALIYNFGPSLNSMNNCLFLENLNFYSANKINFINCKGDKLITEVEYYSTNDSSFNLFSITTFINSYGIHTCLLIDPLYKLSLKKKINYFTFSFLNILFYLII